MTWFPITDTKEPFYLLVTKSSVLGDVYVTDGKYVWHIDPFIVEGGRGRSYYINIDAPRPYSTRRITHWMPIIKPKPPRRGGEL